MKSQKSKAQVKEKPERKRRAKSIRNLHYNITDKKRVAKRETEMAKKCPEVWRAQIPETLLQWIRQRCLEIKEIARELKRIGAVSSLWQNASILLPDEEDGKMIWLYQAPQEHFKIFVNRQFIPVMISGGANFEAPADSHTDIAFVQLTPGHVISLQTPRWLSNLGKKSAA